MQTRPEAPILAVGATGQVGSAVTLGLLRAGLPVRVLVRTPARAQSHVAAGAEPVAGDLRQPGSLPAALQGVTRAFLAEHAEAFGVARNAPLTAV